MHRILLLATLLVTAPACSIFQCGEGAAETTWSWKGEIPRATQLATSVASTAVIWDGNLSVVGDGKAPVTTALELAPLAIAQAPDGSGIVVGDHISAQMFDAIGVPGARFEIDAINADSSAVVFDGTAYLIAWSAGQQVFTARVSTTGQLLAPRTLIGVGAADCPKVGTIGVAAIDDGQTTWITWPAGSAIQTEIVGVRVVAGKVIDPAPLPILGELGGRCADQALLGLAGSGRDALLLAHQTSDKPQQIAVPLHPDGTVGELVELGTAPVRVSGAPHGFALYDPALREVFPRALYTRIRMLDASGVEVVEVDVRGATPVFAHHADRLMVVTGADRVDGDDGTSTLGLTRFYDDGQSLPVELFEANVAHVSETHCNPPLEDY